MPTGNYANPGGGQDADMFSDGAEPQAPEMAETEKPSEGQTAVIPKSLLAGKEFKPGQEVVLKVVAIHDNDVEVEYASEKGPEEGEAPPEEEMAQGAPAGGPGGGEMASMME